MTMQTRKQKGRQYALLLAIVVVASLLAMGIVGILRRGEIVSPPVVEVADRDPAVVAALQAAQDEVRASPRSAAAWGRLGMLLFNYNVLPESRQCFTQAQRLDPREPSWPYYHALTLLSESPSEALDKLRQTVALCGDSPDAPRLRLAELLLECGQLDEAEAQFRRSLDANPDNPRAQFGLARLAYERGDWQRSRELLDAAVRNNFTERLARLLFAQIERRLGNEQAAERERLRAESLPQPPSWPDPYLDKLHRLRAGRQAGIDHITELLAEGRAAEAAAHAEEVIRAYPQAGLAWLLLGQARLRQQQAQGAEAALHRAVQLMPESVEAHFDLGSALLLQNQAAEAAVCFRQAVRLKPTSATAYYSLGLCLLKLDDADGAREALEKAVSYRPQFSEAHRNLGELLARCGRPAEAAEHLRAALQINPDDAVAQKKLDELRPQGARQKP
jgi:tetratricopeptide (TPR) repeat protein